MKNKTKIRPPFPAFPTFSLGASRPSSLAISAALSVAGLFSQSALAATQWEGDVSGDEHNWGNAGNWSAGLPAAANGDTFIVATTASNFPILSTGAYDTNDTYVGAFTSSNSQLDVTGGSIHAGQFIVAPDDTTSGNLVNLSSSGTLNSNYWFIVGRNGGDGSLNMSGGTINSNIQFDHTILANNANSIGVLAITGGAFNIGAATTQNNGGEFWVGENGQGTVNQSAGTLSSYRYLVIGRNNGSAGNYNLSGGTVNGATNAGFAVVGSFGGSQGTLTVSGTGDFNAPIEMRIGETGTGTVSMTGGTVDVGGVTHVGYGGNATTTQKGTLTVSGGTFTSENDFVMHFAGAAGAQADVTVGGGTLNVGSATKRWMSVGQYDFGSSTVNVTSGSLNLNANTDLRFSTGSGGPTATDGNIGTNVVNLNGGAITSFSDNATTANGDGVVDLNRGGSAVNNTFNLNGGTLTVRAIETGSDSGTAVFNFNGGTLRATADNASFLTLGGATQRVNIRNGGAKIDTNGFNVTVGQALEHSVVGGDNAIDGGLTKNGAGILTVASASTYTGNTTVNGGTLSLSANSATTFADTSTVSIATGASLDLPNVVTDTVAGLVLGGVAKVPGTYDSTTPGGFITGSGSIQVVALTGYAAWKVANAGGQPADLDYDNDGVKNGVEYFMGFTGSSFTATPGIVSGKVTWPKDPAFSGSYTVQTSPDLVIWTNVSSTVVGNTVEYTVPTGQGKLFVRLDVVPN